MTIETCSAGLWGSTLQSSRRGGEAANADRALEEVRLRILVRIAEDERRRARCQEQRQRPLHEWTFAEAPRALSKPERADRGEPAAEGPGQDVERPMHPHYGARCRHHHRNGDDGARPQA